MPTAFGRYELIDRIGLGGMAEVWRARVGGVGGFEKTVVIKKILPSFAQNKTFIDMLLAEARLCAVLQHGNIVQVYENGEIDGIFYIAMEFVSGHDLFQVLSRATQTQTRIPPEICLYIAAEAAKGLHFAHNARDHYGRPLNIIHRDVSPSNIILSESGEVKVMDFGVARATPPGGQRENATRSGVLKGKLGYMSPEQVTGRQFDHRSDIFSLGIILYESLTLKRLFLAKTDLETLVNIRDARIEHKFKKHSYIDEDIRNVLRKALAREPTDRYPTALALHDDVQQVLFDRRQHVSGSALSRFLAEMFDGTRAPLPVPEPDPPPLSTRPEGAARGRAEGDAKLERAAVAADAGLPKPPVIATTKAVPNMTPISNSVSFSQDEMRQFRGAAAVGGPDRQMPAVQAPTAASASSSKIGTVRAVAPPRLEAAPQTPAKHDDDDAALLQAALAKAGSRQENRDSVAIIEPPKRPAELRITLVEPRPGSGGGETPGGGETEADHAAEPAIPNSPTAARTAVSKPTYDPFGLPVVAKAPAPAMSQATSARFPAIQPDEDDLGYDSGVMAPATDPETSSLEEGAGAHEESAAHSLSDLQPEPSATLRAGLPPASADSGGQRSATAPMATQPQRTETEPHQPQHLANGVPPSQLGRSLGAGTAPQHQTAPTPSAARPSGPVATAEHSRPPFEVREPTLPPFLVVEPSRPPFDNPEPSRPPFAVGADAAQPPVRAHAPRRASSPRHGGVERTDENINNEEYLQPRSNGNSDLVDGMVLTDRGSQSAFDGRLEAQSYSIAGSVRGLDRNAFRVRLRDGTELGPMSATALETLIKNGTASVDDFVAVGEGSYQPMRSVSQLNAMVTALMESRKPPTLSGPLSQWVFVRLVYKCAADKATGVLELRRGDAVKSVYFRRGRTQYIASNQHQELLGPFMVANGYISQADVDMAVARAKQSGTKLGDLLIGMNLIKPFQLYQVLERQLRTKFIDAFGWDSGNYAFYDGIEAPSDIVPLDIDPISVLAEGVRERVPLAVLEPIFADKLDRRLHKVKNPLINLAALKLQARESKAVTMLHSADTPRQAYDECYSNRQQRLALLHVLFLMLQTELITFDADRA